MELIFILTALGIIFLALEVFLPGGILGIAGFSFLVGAIIKTITTNELDGHPGLRLTIGLGVIFVSCLSLYLGMKYFDRTPFAKLITLKEEVGGGATQSKLLYDNKLIGSSGVAKVDLKPAGVIKVDGKSHKAISRSGFIDRGDQIKVISLEEGVFIVEKPQKS